MSNKTHSKTKKKPDLNANLDVLVLPVVNNVHTIASLKKIPIDSAGSIMKKMRATNETIAKGDLSHLEDMLINQAHTLEEIFYSCTQRMLASEYLGQLRAYSDIALKAQKQCRNTITALAELKNPKQTTFVKHQNNAINQQINLENNSIQSNELLEISHERMDTRPPITSIPVNTPVEAVEKIDRC